MSYITRCSADSQRYLRSAAGHILEVLYLFDNDTLEDCHNHCFWRIELINGRLVIDKLSALNEIEEPCAFFIKCNHEALYSWLLKITGTPKTPPAVKMPDFEKIFKDLEDSANFAQEVTWTRLNREDPWDCMRDI